MERDVNDLVHLLSRGIIERRRFVMMAIAMGLAAPAAVALADRAVAATPKKGGRFGMEAVQSLGKIGPSAREAIPALDALKNESPIGFYAKIALKEIRGF